MDNVNDTIKELMESDEKVAETNITMSVPDKDLIDLKNISEGDLSTANTVDYTKNQLALFLIMQARKELKRIVKLTEALDTLQDVYVDKSMEFLMRTGDAQTSIEYIPSMMENIMKCLERSSNVISKVMSDKNIANLLIVDASDKSINIGNPEDLRTGIDDPVSRSKIREAISKVVAYLEEENSSNGI